MVSLCGSYRVSWLIGSGVWTGARCAGRALREVDELEEERQEDERDDDARDELGGHTGLLAARDHRRGEPTIRRLGRRGRHGSGRRRSGSWEGGCPNEVFR